MKLTEEYQKKWDDIRRETLTRCDTELMEKARLRFLAEVIIPEAFEAGENFNDYQYGRNDNRETTTEFLSKIIEQ